MKIITFIIDLILIYLTPIILFGIGAILKNKTEKTINSSNVYCSSFEKKYKKIWGYAQEIAPEIMKKYAVLLGVFITLLLVVSLITQLEYKTVYNICTDIWIMVGGMSIYIIAVERKIRIKFDKEGNLIV